MSEIEVQSFKCHSYDVGYVQHLLTYWICFPMVIQKRKVTLSSYTWAPYFFCLSFLRVARQCFGVVLQEPAVVCCYPPYTATLVWNYAFKEPVEWRILFGLAWYADNCNVCEINNQGQLYPLECEDSSRHHPCFRIQLSQFSRLKVAKGNHKKSKVSEMFRSSSASDQNKISHVCGAKFVQRVQQGD